MESSKHSNRGKSQRDSQIKVVTNWQHTEQVSSGFRRLMCLLLEPKYNRITRTIEEGNKDE